MSHQDMDRLLEQGLSGDGPGQVFRARVLRDSTATFVRARQSRIRWRPAAFSVTAVLIAAVSFLLGRCSAPPSMPRSATGPAIARAADAVAVPSELVVWLDAARLFKQLGMEDRMSRAIDCAGRLLPREVIATGSATELVSAAGNEGVECRGGNGGATSVPALQQSLEPVNRILAGSLGGCYHANGRN